MDYRNSFFDLEYLERDISNRTTQTKYLKRMEQSPCHPDHEPGCISPCRCNRLACPRLSQMAGFAAKFAPA
jgi:hypothetical protein